MFQLEEDKTIDFLTQTNLKKIGLHRAEAEFRKNVEEERGHSRAERKEPSVIRKEREFRKEEDIPEIRADNCEKIRMKIRLDYRGLAQPGRLFFKKKSIEEIAEEQREQKMALWQNLPVQGIDVLDIKVYDIYTVTEEEDGYEEEVAYAPIELIVNADSLEDCAYIVSREEFRRVEIVNPKAGIKLTSRETEKLLLRFSEFFKRFYEEESY